MDRLPLIERPRLFAGLLLLLFILLAVCFVRADITVTANVKSLLGQGVSTSGYFQPTLLNCSQGPTINGVVIDTNPARNQVAPDKQTGAATFKLYWNDTEISCAGAFTSYYEISYWSVGKKVWSKRFQFVHTASTADLSTYPELQALPPGPIPDYAVRNGNNAYTGTQDFRTATVVGADTPGNISFDIEGPSPADSGRFQHRVYAATTLLEIACDTDPGGSAQISLEIRSAPNSPGTDVLSSPLMCGQSFDCASSSGCTSSFAVTAIPARALLAPKVISAAAGIVRIHVHTQ